MKINFLYFFLILFPSFLFSQSEGTIRGFVYEDSSSEPIIYANVSLLNTSFGSTTDDNGYFIFPNVPSGDYVLQVNFMGYETKSLSVQIKNGKMVFLEQDKAVIKNVLKIRLSTNNQELQVVELNVDKDENKTNVNNSVIKLSVKNLEKLPSLGGEVDLAQFFQVLPGVVFTGDQGGRLYIRGGAPIHNKVLLDGMIIYNPFHSIGFFSVFDTDIIKKTDVYTGGFPSRYGGRISSIIDIKTRDGNKKKFSGKLSANTFSSKFLLEGPLLGSNNNKSENSFIVSLRSSYLDKTSKNFYSYISEDGLPYSFTDLYGKFSIFSENGSKINLYGFNFEDNVDYKDLTSLGWRTYGLGSNFVLVPGSAKMLIEGKVTYSDYKISQENESNQTINSGINGFSLNLDFSYFISKTSDIKYGLNVLGYSTSLDFINSAGTYINEIDHSTEFAAYLDYNFSKNRILINPGFRLQNYTSLGETMLEPRIAFKYNLTEKLRLKASAGLFSQNLISTNDETEVVSLFSGFLSTTTSIPDNFNGEDIESFLQKSTHYIVGLEYDIIDNLNLNLEFYFKDFSQLIGLNRNKIYEDIPEFSSTPDYLKTDFMVERGNATGLDVLIKYNTKNISIWSAYSYSIVNKEDEIQTYHPHYDRRHNFNFVFSYLFGDKRTWEINTRWNYGTGFPFTRTQAYYEQINFSENNSGYTVTNGQLGVLYSDLNDGRLPDYHRLDISLKKKINLKNKTSLEVSLGVTNLYNRNNIFYYDRVSAVRVDQLPIMPNIGFNWKF